jgi:hypothetical protein
VRRDESALARTEHLFASEKPPRAFERVQGRRHLPLRIAGGGASLPGPTYLNRRMCTFMSSPIPMKFAISALPPYETSGSGIPVIGMIPSVIPMFTKT